MSNTHTIHIGWLAGAQWFRDSHTSNGKTTLFDNATKLGPDLAVQILDNHGHRLVVSDADIAAGADKTYDIRGDAAHTHTVTITAAMFLTLTTIKGAIAAVLNSNDVYELALPLQALQAAVEPVVVLST